MTFEFQGWFIYYYMISTSAGHGNSGRGRSESRGDAFDKYLHRRHARTTSARDTPVAAHVTNAENHVTLTLSGSWRDGVSKSVSRAKLEPATP